VIRRDGRPLREQDQDGGNNLPASLSSFVGRARELRELQALLTTARLVTLTGVGGCGKTRLALEVARAVQDRYPDGVWLVELAALSDAALVPQRAAAVFGMRETQVEPIAAALARTLRGRSLLLVLDNCEHLLDACARLAEAILRTCPDVRVLATSREALGITGEVAWLVPSLPLPDPSHPASLAELEASPAVQLFAQRAAAVQRQFALTERNAAVVAQMCQRLDGIPLALELAAARIEALGIEQLGDRLDQLFQVLTGGSRVALPRQQTLQATLDWSHDLLTVSERRLFNRLSVFSGGWTLQAAEALGGGAGVAQRDVLDLLQQLVRKSLVIVELGGNGIARYRLLETVRQYAHQRLLASGDAGALRERHARYYLTLAEALGPGMYDWAASAIERLLIEHDNLRAALRWFVETNAVEQATRLGGQMWGIWVNGGYLVEGRAQLCALLALPGLSSGSETWARLAYSYGLVELFLGNYAASRASLEEVAAAQRASGDRLLATTLGSVGQAAREQGDYVAARVWLLESLSHARDLDLRPVIAHALLRLGTVAHAQGELAPAQAYLEESLARSRQLDDRIGIAWSLYHIGSLALDRGDYATARAWLGEGMASFPAFDQLGLTYTLAGLAVLAAAEGEPQLALRLAGATAALTERTGISVRDIDGLRYERWLAVARQTLVDGVASAAWADGRRLPLEQALAHALSTREPAAPAIKPPHPRPAQTSVRLTPRQREVAALIVQGLTNRQIAEQLSVTERAVAAHVEHILDKLGVSNRAQIAVWGYAQGLVETRSD
jgi:predicted ATPase/DNA-binding CsgD family transcriptional regulator